MIERPLAEAESTKYWLTTLSSRIAFKELVRLIKLRWRIKCDNQELKQELGLGHCEGRNLRGFHHRATLTIAAYGFLMRARLSGRATFMKHRKAAVFLVLDGHPSNHAKIVRECVHSLKGRLELHFLPGYAPGIQGVSG
ncbi:MAG: transposase [Gammaproteobacteria bacterium]|nr:transposase [Gammaproteobacteria bacterium]